MRYTIACLFVAALCALPAGQLASQEAPAAETAPGTVHVFNGKDLGGWYTYLKDRGRDQDPKGVFTVSGGMLHISGEEFGCVTSQAEFENCRIVMEFKWGEATYANRVKAARDSGLLVHSVGEDGAYGGMWMHSIECQMIEGGTGDVLVVGDGSDDFEAMCPVAPEKSGSSYVYQPDGQPVSIHSGRINWFGRDPDWKDVKGFRGRQDVEKPVGEWNTYECIAAGDTLTVILNGVTMNKCLAVKPCKGRIQIQSEGAELFVRRLDVIPIPAP